MSELEKVHKVILFQFYLAIGTKGDDGENEWFLIKLEAGNISDYSKISKDWRHSIFLIKLTCAILIILMFKYIYESQLERFLTKQFKHMEQLTAKWLIYNFIIFCMFQASLSLSRSLFTLSFKNYWIYFVFYKCCTIV